MKKLLLTVAIVVVGTGTVEAQSTCFLPSACGTTTFTGGTLTGPLLLPNGSAAAPSLAFSANTNTGIWNSGNTIMFAVAGNDRFQITGAAFGMPSNTGGLYWGSSADVWLYRDAANTLALRNSTNAQKINIYETYTDASNYSRLFISSPGAADFAIGTEAAGTGTLRGISFALGGTPKIALAPSYLIPSSNDTIDLGLGTFNWRMLGVSRSIQGSKSKALTEGAATAVTQIAVPQTAGSNYADAEVRWTVYASDGTDSQTRRGTTYLAAVNKAGTETCTVGDVGTPIVAVSAGTLTCTSSCIVGLTDAVQFALDCSSSLTQTTLTAETRLDMMKPNTVTPQ